MGSRKASPPDRWNKLSPAVRARVEQSRKHFHCDLFAFWRQCSRPGCRQRHRCLGDPQGCFPRHHAALPPNHRHGALADFLLRTTTPATMEQALRAAGGAARGRIRLDRSSKPRRAWRAATAAVRAGDSQEGRRAGGPDRPGRTPDAAEPRQVEWSPATGSSEEAVRTAGLPPPAGVALAGAGPASSGQPSVDQPSVGQADEAAAGPPPPKRPPGLAPWHASYDDEGNFHRPEPEAVKERYRMMTRDEVAERLRALGQDL
jgi:hypothetical protein